MCTMEAEESKSHTGYEFRNMVVHVSVVPERHKAFNYAASHAEPLLPCVFSQSQSQPCNFYSFTKSLQFLNLNICNDLADGHTNALQLSERTNYRLDWFSSFIPASQPPQKEILILPRTPSKSFLSPRSIKPALKRSIALLRTWLPVLIFACIFAVESTAAFGADRTSAPLHSIVASVLGSSVDQDWSNTHHIIRKTGHFTGYGTFSLVCFRGFWLTLRNRVGQALGLALNPALRMGVARQLICHGLAIATTFLVASADELHQSFLPNRTGIFSDVILDTTGAFALQLVLFTTLQAIAKWPRHRANQAQLEAR